ncbi:MAG: polyphosphate polymerase domain-containing protein [Myxococcota bacterium]
MNDPTPDPLRYEIKYVARASELPRLLAWVKNTQACFTEPYPPRQVNNIYFDTFDHFAYAENISGASARSKVRLRWYGEIDNPDQSVLEVKRRRSGIGWKLAYRVGPLTLVGVPWRSIRRRIRAQLSPEATLWLDASPQPVLINRYRRRYFLSRDGRVRLTVDWNQRVYDERISSSPNLTRLANLPDTLVVELKFDRSDRKLANRHAQGIPLRISRNSKYVVGVQAISQD